MEALERLREVVGGRNVVASEAIEEDYTRDECLTTPAQVPAFLVKPESTEQVARILKVANELRIPVTARGSGTGLSGACTPKPDGIVLSFERMKRIIEIDESNHVAVVQPGVTLSELDQETAKKELIYPIFPGESSASIGGNIATNAGGMRAVKYGVTRHQVLGLEAVLANGEIIRTGGKFVKVSSGYDLTQLIIGSEGTLALVTEITLKLIPRLPHRATLLAAFRALDAVTQAVPALMATGVGPLMIEYIDRITMMGLVGFTGIELGVPESIKEETEAYLVVVVEGRTEDSVQADLERVGETCSELGALDVYLLSAEAAAQLIDAREKSFWAGKRVGIADIVDVVVPRGSIPEYMRRVSGIAGERQTLITGCGHAGDGNIHLGVFEADPDKRYEVVKELLGVGLEFGGAVSAEHGIGLAKKKFFSELEDPTKLELMRGIKRVFDPNNILNPGTIFD
jgi:glycolate oxidase